MRNNMMSSCLEKNGTGNKNALGKGLEKKRDWKPPTDMQYPSITGVAFPTTFSTTFYHISHHPHLCVALWVVYVGQGCKLLWCATSTGQHCSPQGHPRLGDGRQPWYDVRQ